MSGLPEVTVAGTLVADPELKWLDSGACVANFTIAANDRRYDRERGEWVDGDATFLPCSIWRQQAEHVCESLSQGLRVLATGVLKQRKWETEHGEKRSAFELAVSEIGASLKFATATVAKTRGSTEPAPASSGAATPRGSGDEPPF
jgi:single-strand DNA-binding protein